MHYLITGHTGFKGSWLTLLLASRGHTVSGLALDPVPGGLYETAGLRDVVSDDLRVDIRNPDATAEAIASIAPDVVLHLAAQPLVRESYREPRATIETNVNGTMNVLEAVAQTASVSALVVVTTDKVYRNVGQPEGYVEDDALGGRDPYSASKAMADLLTQSWVASFPGVPTAIARAGNVIGGGDASPDRLLPDLMGSFAANRVTPIRYPEAIRPWQHVLDCLNGYLALVDALLSGSGTGEWNFGPDERSFVNVGAVADDAAALWGRGARWSNDGSDHPHEASILALDASKASDQLNWHNRLAYPESLRWTIDWQLRVEAGEPPREVSQSQIAEFETLQ